MSQNDTSGYILRYNEILSRFEYAAGTGWIPIPNTGSGSSPNVSFASSQQQNALTGVDFSNFQHIGLLASITPTNSSAKILITGNVFVQATQGNANTVRLSIFRDGTNLLSSWIAGIDFNDDHTSDSDSQNVPFVWMDTPGDTASHTYEIMATVNTINGGIMYVGIGTGIIASLLLQEIH